MATNRDKGVFCCFLGLDVFKLFGDTRGQFADSIDEVHVGHPFAFRGLLYI